MSNLSRYQNRARRSARQAANSLKRYNNVPNNNTRRIITQKTLLEFTIKDSDIMIICDPDYILTPYYLYSKYMVRNDTFYNKKISADKIGIIYSQKKKLYYILAINDDYRCYILFKGKELKDLPCNIVNRLSNIDKLDTVNMYQLSENSNRLMNCVFDQIIDITTNPIFLYNTSELFRR